MVRLPFDRRRVRKLWGLVILRSGVLFWYLGGLLSLCLRSALTPGVGSLLSAEGSVSGWDVGGGRLGLDDVIVLTGTSGLRKTGYTGRVGVVLILVFLGGGE